MKNPKLKKETIKEIGKLFFDVFKIVFAISLITPLTKGESINVFAILFTSIPLGCGIYFTNKGVKK